MIQAVIIILVMAGLGLVLWIGQACRTMRFVRGQMADAWTALKAALDGRRDMVPYIVAAVPARVAPDLDVLGNACDMTANVNGVRECSQAEARLSAAISRLFAQLDADAGIELREALLPLRERLQEQEMRIEVLKGVYNREAELFNALQRGGAARVLVSMGLVKPAELF